jgi:hypothetical protein
LFKEDFSRISPKFRILVSVSLSDSIYVDVSLIVSVSFLSIFLPFYLFTVLFISYSHFVLSSSHAVPLSFFSPFFPHFCVIFIYFLLKYCEVFYRWYVCRWLVSSEFPVNFGTKIIRSFPRSSRQWSGTLRGSLKDSVLADVWRVNRVLLLLLLLLLFSIHHGHF